MPPRDTLKTHVRRGSPWDIFRGCLGLTGALALGLGQVTLMGSEGDGPGMGSCSLAQGEDEVGRVPWHGK